MPNLENYILQISLESFLENDFRLGNYQSDALDLNELPSKETQVAALH